MAYITTTDIANHLGITLTAGQTTLSTVLIESAEDYIETLCGGGVIPKRVFDSADTDSTRYYDGDDSAILTIDDLRAVTSVSLDDTALVKDEDYYLLPYNATTDGEPFTQIALIQPETRINGNSRLTSSVYYLWEKGQRNVSITGKFGYSTSVPNTVKLAVLRIVAQFLKDSIGGTAKEISSESLGEYSVTHAKVKEVADRLGVADMLSKYIHPLSPLSPRTLKGSRVATFKVS